MLGAYREFRKNGNIGRRINLPRMPVEFNPRRDRRQEPAFPREGVVADPRRREMMRVIVVVVGRQTARGPKLKEGVGVRDVSAASIVGRHGEQRQSDEADHQPAGSPTQHARVRPRHHRTDPVRCYNSMRLIVHRKCTALLMGIPLSFEQRHIEAWHLIVTRTYQRDARTTTERGRWRNRRKSRVSSLRRRDLVHQHASNGAGHVEAGKNRPRRGT